MIAFTEGLDRALLDSDVPVVTDYEFYVLGKRLFDDKQLAGEPLKRLPGEWDQLRSRRAIRRLQARSSVVPDADFRSGVWRVVQSTRSGSAEEIACIADPFCYVSHLSAMQRYGLTDRSPQALHLTTPARLVWNVLRDRKVEKDLGPSADREHSPLLRPGFDATIRRRPVVVHETRHPAQPVQLRGERTRISTVGRTLVDAIAQPELCGGMHHALDIWGKQVETWGDELVDEVDRSESKIVKVRAGYILSELLGIENATIKGWERFAQRGGSRKLDPGAAYAPLFSERWMISLNV